MKTVRMAGGMRSVALAGIGVALAALLGCGDATKATVKGTAKYNGQTITGGEIHLAPDGEGTETYIHIKGDGSFTSPDVKPGKYKVGVKPVTDNPGAAVAPPPGSSTPPATAASDEKPMNIPMNFQDPAKSGIPEWEIKPGTNSETIDIK